MRRDAFGIHSKYIMGHCTIHISLQTNTKLDSNNQDTTGDLIDIMIYPGTAIKEGHLPTDSLASAK